MERRARSWQVIRRRALLTAMAAFAFSASGCADPAGSWSAPPLRPLGGAGDPPPAPSWVKLRRGGPDTLEYELGHAVGMTLAGAEPVALVGGPRRSGSSGYAAVFERQGADWVETPLEPAGGALRRYGFSVAISGDVAVVAATDTTAGEPDFVTIFARDAAGWTSVDTLDTIDPDVQLGTSVAVSGVQAALGRPRQANAGSIALLQRMGGVWSGLSWSPPGTVDTGDRYGQAVAISPEVLAIGAPGDDQQATGAGAVYLHLRAGNAWDAGARTFGSDIAAGDGFGATAAAFAGTVAVGAPSKDVNRGVVYLFEHDGGAWQEIARLEAPEPAAGDRFGASVAVGDGLVAVGAPAYDDGMRPGAVHLYRRADGGWHEHPIELPALSPGDHFGASVSLAGSWLLVGAPGDDEGGLDAGAAYLVDLSALPAPCDAGPACGGGGGGGGGAGGGGGGSATTTSSASTGVGTGAPSAPPPDGSADSFYACAAAPPLRRPSALATGLSAALLVLAAARARRGRRRSGLDASPPSRSP